MTVYCLHIYKCASSMNIYIAFYYIYIYILGACLRCVLCMLRELTWLVCQLGMYVLDTSQVLYIRVLITYYHYISLLLMKSPPCFLWLAIDKYIWISYLHVLRLHFHTWWHFDHIIMTLKMNNGHIIYYHMDTTQSVSWAWAYFNHPDYLVIQSWIHTTHVFPDTITQTRPHVYHYVKFFLGVGYTPQGRTCNCIVAILDYFDATQPLTATAYPTL